MRIFILYNADKDQPSPVGLYSTYEKAAEVRDQIRERLPHNGPYFILDHELDEVPGWLKKPEESR